METRRGVITNVKSSVEISSGGNDSAVTTTHVCCFQLCNVPVMIKSRNPVMIVNDNNVVVSGTASGGVFRALAYRNESTGATGDTGVMLNLIIGMVFPGVALFMYPKFNTPFFGDFPKFFFGFFVCFGVWLVLV